MQKNNNNKKHAHWHDEPAGLFLHSVPTHSIASLICFAPSHLWLMI